MDIKFELISWYNQHKKDLPWRKSNDPYKIWISEIILQQTRINQGLSYYENFIKKFPTLESLAKSNEEEVLKLWQGLGYYSRARNIHFTAKTIFFERNNVFPTIFNELTQLKGIGKYTAAAIASITFNEPVSAIDGNAFRVYARLHTIDLDINKSSTFSYFFDLANELIDKDNPGDFNQAIMDLGSTICLPKNPLCDSCPVNKKCKAYAQNSVEFYPIKSKKKAVSIHTINYILIFDNQNNFILRKRNNKSIWANLFDLPEMDDELFKNHKIEFLFSINHLLTHKKLEISFYQTKISDIKFNEINNSNQFFFKANKQNLLQFALPKPIEILLNKVVYL